MQLILTSGSSPWNTNYCNESGQVLYKASAPGWCLLGRNIKISRTISPTQYEKKVDSPFDSDDTKTLVDPSIYSHRPPRSLAEEDESGFECIGEVEYHVFKKSYIKYGGVDRPVNQFFKQVGFGFYGRHRLFTGPDGKEYIWKMTPNVCKLYLDETLVATFHRKHYGIFSPKRPASLEIFPQGEHMVELILVTFIYMEKLRSEKERCRRAAAAGGGGP